MKSHLIIIIISSIALFNIDLPPISYIEAPKNALVPYHFQL